VSIPPGDRLGEGTIDEPDSEDGCKRKRDEPNVLRAGDIAPAVAFLLSEEAGWITGQLLVADGGMSHD